MNSQQALQKFAEAPTVEDQKSSLTLLLKEKALYQNLQNPLFTEGLDKLLKAAAGDNARERLLAISTLSRIAKAVKRLRGTLKKRLATILKEPLPSLELIREADDRFYIVSAWRFSSAPWWREYLAAAAVEEDTGENARFESLEGLLTLAPNISLVLRELNEKVRNIRFETEVPADSMGRRVRRLLESLRLTLSKLPTEAGSEPGKSYAGFLTAAFRVTGVPTTLAVKHAVTEEAAKFLHEIIRLSFSVSTDCTTYRALDILRDWYGAREWSEFIGESGGMRLVANDLSEALRMLVRAGITDDSLLNELVHAVGSEERARELRLQFVQEMPGLEEHVQHWLAGTAPRKSSPVAAESQQRSMDEILSDLMIDSAKLSAELGLLEQDLLPEISVIAPRVVEPLRSFLRLFRHVATTIARLGESRSLRVSGTLGKPVEFSPLEHEMIGGFRPGIRYVRLVRPAVEALEVDGRVRIVRRALVEAVDQRE